MDTVQESKENRATVILMVEFKLDDLIRTKDENKNVSNVYHLRFVDMLSMQDLLRPRGHQWVKLGAW